MKEPDYISHLRQYEINGRKNWEFQSNDEHLLGVAKLAERFAMEFGCGKLGKLIGLLHDKGKEQHAFQLYIRKESGYMPQIRLAPRIPHAYVGALIAKKLYPHLFPLLSYPIAAHHAGLYDSYDFEVLMKQTIPPEFADVMFSVDEKLDETALIPPFQPLPHDFNHMVRMFFSCLVDADYLDTEKFMDKETYRVRRHHADLISLLPRLEGYLMKLSEEALHTDLNKLRAKIQEVCRKKSEGTPGFYSLTVPTGGGKTLASLLWAIKHAVKYGKKRIIIAIPYTSIIVQTAATLRKIFGDENVCEHHSTFDPEEVWKDRKDHSKLEMQQRLATENWDYPIVVTTNVQLFESMFSNRPSVCRKLHNIANSVLVLDEVQTIPCEFLQPIVAALDSYQRLFRTSILFTTASLPVLIGNHYGTNKQVVFKGLSEVTEIIPSNWNLQDKLRRVALNFDNQISSYDDIAKRLSNYDKVLCIVNTRVDAFEIFKRLPDESYTFHLSRRMCSQHIQDTIEEIRKALQDPLVKTVRVVATQLIEAGVDIDFPVVFRQEAGLDSILQAAGRCNREGRLGISNTYVFKLNKPLPRGMLSSANNARKNLCNINDWFSPRTMFQYFVHLYAMCDSFDKKNIMGDLIPQKHLFMQFQQAASDFRLIDNQGKNIVVNYKNSLGLIKQLKEKGYSYEISKKLGKFIVNINDADFRTLMQEGLLEEAIEGLYFVSAHEQYNHKTGLTTYNHWMDEILIQ